MITDFYKHPYYPNPTKFIRKEQDSNFNPMKLTQTPLKILQNKVKYAKLMNNYFTGQTTIRHKIQTYSILYFIELQPTSVPAQLQMQKEFHILLVTIKNIAFVLPEFLSSNEACKLPHDIYLKIKLWYWRYRTLIFYIFSTHRTKFAIFWERKSRNNKNSITQTRMSRPLHI